jgi:hypothetical protein
MICHQKDKKQNPVTLFGSPGMIGSSQYDDKQ